MVFIPNTRVTIFRGTFQDDFDDTHDTNQAIAIDVPALLMQKAQSVRTSESGRSYDVDSIQGTVRNRVDVQQGDRLVDQQTGLVYTVDAITTGLWTFLPNDTSLKLRHLA